MANKSEKAAFIIALIAVAFVGFTAIMLTITFFNIK